MSIEEKPTGNLETVKVEALTPNSKQVNTTVKVLSKSPVRETISRRDGSVHRVADALVGDETGSIYLTLWDDNIDAVKEDNILDIKNGYISLFKGSMRLNIGRYGSISSSTQTIDVVNTDNNLSDKQFEQERRYPTFKPRYGGDYRGEGRRGHRRFGSRRRF